jgi:hypothetical protein
MGALECMFNQLHDDNELAEIIDRFVFLRERLLTVGSEK